ncbi:hypothetical protein N1851_005750 [Merluccius polli]|uniref:Uncharacterized protein n=1 Tax=Merluccius polli TaxID=89951 RepID=A0AA47PAW8_MERPO|nr:hypothetical protein N1851_005750 [Merluccius polli]
MDRRGLATTRTSLKSSRERKKWLRTDSAFKTLSDHVLNKTLLKDLNHMTFFKHTGTLRYDLVFPKQTKRWVARKRYEPTRQTFRKDLVERVLERRQDPTVKFADPKFYIQKPPTISDNIATTPRPDKEQSIAEHVSRFKT